MFKTTTLCGSIRWASLTEALGKACECTSDMCIESSLFQRLCRVHLTLALASCLLFDGKQTFPMLSSLVQSPCIRAWALWASYGLCTPLVLYQHLYMQRF